MIRLLTIIFICICCFTSCKRQHHIVTPAFFYWKTVYHLGTAEKQALNELHCKKIYIRYFDVDVNVEGTILPNAIIRFTQKLDSSFEFVPTIFLTQRALSVIKLSDSLIFAKKLVTLIASIDTLALLHPHEIQIDCDWTSKNKELYFSLLRCIKAQLYLKDKLLSCTLRMHQAKFTGSSGIPPVDRALLMCYNMGNIKQPDNHNSILDADLAIEYLKSIAHYPLNLDIGLPIFQWCVLFRNNKFDGIVRDLEPLSLKNNENFSRHGNTFYCNRDTLLHNYYIHKGDKIRAEMPNLQEIDKLAKFASQQDNSRSLNIVFFHLDSLNLSKYPSHELETILDNFR